MGCINSRADINDLYPNIFQVINVDDFGNLVTQGRLEITDTDIILYQRDKQPIKWPLKCLRRYGHDAEIFSFESGRRCSTGPGIYAFKCRQAAHLFNLVQTNIQVCNNSIDDTISRELPVAAQTVPSGTRVTIPFEPNYLDPTPTRFNNRIGTRFVHNEQNGIGRLSSVGSSNGPMSPQETISTPSPPPILPPPPPPPPLPSTISHSHSSSLYINEEILSIPLEMEHNNNKSLRRMAQRSCAVKTSSPSNGTWEMASVTKNQDISSSNKPSLPSTVSYMNVDISNEVSSLSPSHSTLDPTTCVEEINEPNGLEHPYMNINPGNDPADSIAIRVHALSLPALQSDPEDGSRHCYANLESAEIESLKKRFSGISISDKSSLPPSTPTGIAIREVNYAVLDLDRKDESSLDGAVHLTPSPPESPNKTQEGYAIIDFNKTAALSHSVNPNLLNDNEGSRKTRHNSTINDLSASCRLSSSISE
ncbi:fibroblast growth factor receptor substrate 2 isoform X1 [Polistes fuscatus]|uniref:fibroblast growth factor receptor substrate 2 isoform X1 n=1 Tax=Polistes fuscatus TaxID=30207 RepID=UPI001CA89C3F|nr:fibroblast growth factor receptor substrate 2 isoform X1 [Polistes fuscatus]